MSKTSALEIKALEIKSGVYGFQECGLPAQSV